MARTNPFATPARRRDSRFANIAQFGLQLAELQQRQRLSDKEVAAQTRVSDLAEKKFKFDVGEADRRALIDVAKIKSTERVARGKIPFPEQEITFGEMETVKSQATEYFSAMGLGKKEIDPWMATFDSLLQKKSTRVMALMTVRDVGNQLMAPILENLAKQKEKLIAGNVGGVNADKIKAIEAYQTEMAKPTNPMYDDRGQWIPHAIDAHFGRTVKHMRRSEASARSLQARALELKKAGQAAVQQFSEPFEDKFGNLVQRNLTTGKVSKVSTPPTGMEITTADGTTIRTGVRTGSGTLAKKTIGDIQKKKFSGLERLATTQRIKKLFRPEFQTLGVRWKTFATKWKEKLKGTPVEKLLNLDVSGQDRTLLREYTTYRKTAMTNLNQGIHDRTGAQVGRHEVPRIKAEFPDPGQGLFDGDSYTEFRAKTNESLRLLTLADYRYGWYLKQGLSQPDIDNLVNTKKAISIDEMQNMLEEQGQAVLSELTVQNPNANAGELLKLMQAKINEVFGMQ